jgi:hypothetical protein
MLARFEGTPRQPFEAGEKAIVAQRLRGAQAVEQIGVRLRLAGNEIGNYSDSALNPLPAKRN